MKTNKSYRKRVRVTKNGKIVARRAGQNHFNAKQSGKTHQRRRRTQVLQMKQRDRRRFLPST